ncbi:mannose-1-phosphate guanylyltransferase [Pseudothermotoga sp.]|nr:mannose-1-phosphate guanylyltransferase [Pseudothermotoga sp.]MDW8139697.1 mannose-1-phosphate guanylyltransferase [Pseudothermotoga sp.]
MKCVILAGGSGERFWPLSTKETPKQFLKLFSDKTLLRETFERIAFKLSPKDIYIVTNRAYAETTYKELPEIPRQNVLLEPAKKNTAPACSLASLNFEDGETIFVVPSDHYIPETEKFWHHVQIAEDFLKDHEGIITFGITPTRVETGYGYIESGEQLQENVFKVKKFHEKPDVQTATFYLSQGNYFWNSGMFMWKKSYFVEQMKKHAPEVIAPFLENLDIEKVYEKVPSISIDYALMEKADAVYMVKASFIWSDVGNFNSLKEMGLKNSEHCIIESSENVFVRTTKPTIVIGVDNTVVVETENGLLVCNTSMLDRIKEAIKKLPH